mgnify:CR=1 FL=1
MSEARVNNLSNESNSGGPTISGITTFSGTNFFVPPVGNTAERPDNPEAGSLRFNTDSKSLEYFKGDTIGWAKIEASHGQLDGGTRMLFMGGTHASGSPHLSNKIEYVTIPTLGNVTDFGDLVAEEQEGSAATNHLRGLYFGGDPADNEIEYVTFSSTGNATDFGDCTTTSKSGTSCSDRNRGVMILGAGNNVINHIQFSTTGNAVDFGDVSMVNSAGSGSSSSTRGVFAVGSSDANYKNIIEYITISTTGNSTDFGDLTRTGVHCVAYSNATRGVWHSGYQYPSSPNFMNVIDYVTIATTGNATDFGDSLLGGYGAGGSSPTRGVAGGGYSAGAPTGETGGFTNIIDYTQIMTTGNAKDFGDLSYRIRHIKGGSNGHGGL